MNNAALPQCLHLGLFNKRYRARNRFSKAPCNSIDVVMLLNFSIRSSNSKCLYLIHQYFIHNEFFLVQSHVDILRPSNILVGVINVSEIDKIIWAATEIKANLHIIKRDEKKTQFPRFLKPSVN
ncbi:hypothetical protein HZS_5705 [Henneguya salminicola]|nr:hypothetical protein HZS_5705 [Henneguya salminicola]